MSADSAIATVKTFMSKMGTDLPSAFALASDDMKWQFNRAIPENNVRTKEEIMGMLGKIFTKFEMIVDEAYASSDGKKVAIECRSKAVLTNGEPYENSYSFHFELDGGKIKVVKEFADSGYARDAFARDAARKPAE